MDGGKPCRCFQKLLVDDEFPTQLVKQQFCSALRLLVEKPQRNAEPSDLCEDFHRMIKQRILELVEAKLRSKCKRLLNKSAEQCSTRELTMSTVDNSSSRSVSAASQDEDTVDVRCSKMQVQVLHGNAELSPCRDELSSTDADETDDFDDITAGESDAIDYAVGLSNANGVMLGQHGLDVDDDDVVNDNGVDDRALSESDLEDSPPDNRNVGPIQRPQELVLHSSVSADIRRKPYAWVISHCSNSNW